MRFFFGFYVFLFSITSSHGQTFEKQIVNFTSAEYLLSENAKNKINSFIENKSSSIDSIEVIGHTDSDGEENYNVQLSYKRVESVAKFLSQNGFKVDKKSFLGEKQPLNKNYSTEDKAINRRVEIILHLKTRNSEDISSLEELYKKLEKPNQKYCIDPLRDTTLFLSEGTGVNFPANTFSGCGCITIQAREYYKTSDIILQNLNTQSYGQILETGGMVYLEAQDCNGKTIEAQKEFTIYLPTDSILSDMETFYGNHDSTGMRNWMARTEQERIPNIDSSMYDLLQFRNVNVCEKCKFFFCRIKRTDEFLGGTFNKENRMMNKKFRQCQKNLRKSGNKKIVTTTEGNYRRYTGSKIMDYYQNIIDSLGFQNRDELYAYLLDKRKKEIEEANQLCKERMQNGKGTLEDMEYYVLISNRLGYINCDRFADIPEDQKIKSTSETIIEKEKINCKMIFRGMSAIMPGIMLGSRFNFQNIPRNRKIILISIKIENGKIYLSKEETLTTEKLPNFNFKQVTLAELQDEMSTLDEK